MTVALHELRFCHAADELRTFAPPTDDPEATSELEKTAERPVSRQASPRRRTILSQLLALCGGAEGRAIDTKGLCGDLPGEDDRITIDDELSLACPSKAKSRRVGTAHQRTTTDEAESERRPLKTDNRHLTVCPWAVPTLPPTTDTIDPGGRPPCGSNRKNGNVTIGLSAAASSATRFALSALKTGSCSS